MSMFQWKPEYSVDHSEIDAQHKRLFQLAEELHAAMAAGKGKDALSPVLASLIDYTKRHFASEERLMRLHDYPEYAGHKQQHDDLTRRVAELQQNHAAGKTAITVELLNFLRDWLTHHIGEMDRKIAMFLKTKAA